jgi:hypothetical protein
MKIKSSSLLLSLSLSLFSVCGGNAGGAVIFSQDFGTGGVVADYVNVSSPTTSQWNAIGSSGAAKTWAVSSNALSITSTGANAAYAARTTDFAITPSAVSLTFDVELISSTAITSAFQFSFGTGFDTTNSLPANADVYAKFGLNFTDTNGFSVRDVGGGTNGAATYGAGVHTITFVSNNSGSLLTYLAPNGSSETLADDKWDIWVDASKQLDDRAVTTSSVAMTDFKLGVSGTGNYSLKLDNIQITSIPEPTTALLGALGLLGLLRRRR